MDMVSWLTLLMPWIIELRYLYESVFYITKHFSWRKGKLMLFSLVLNCTVCCVLPFTKQISSKYFLMYIWIFLFYHWVCQEESDTPSVCWLKYLLKGKVNRLIKMFCFSRGLCIKMKLTAIFMGVLAFVMTVEGFFFDCDCHSSCFSSPVSHYSLLNKRGNYTSAVQSCKSEMFHNYLLISESIFLIKVYKKALVYSRIL